MCKRLIMGLALFAFANTSFTIAPHAAPPATPESGITATFSIVAVDPETGVCGAAVASKYPAVGKVVPYVRGGVGAFCTQHWHNPKWGEKALDLLADGKPPEEVLTDLLRDGPLPNLLLACGPAPMLRAVSAIALQRNVAAQLSLEETFACGVGACWGCVVPVDRSSPQAPGFPMPSSREPRAYAHARICKEGPVFWAHELRW